MQAIVLSRRDFRESDQIISLYTKEKGKLELLARGVKKITSKNSAHLEPFSFVDIDIAHGKEIDHLTKVQPIEYFKNIRNDLEKTLATQHIISITNKLVQPNEEDERIFWLLHSWLFFISIGQLSNVNCQMLIDGYIVVLLRYLGFAITEDEKMKKWIVDLKVLESGDWETMNQLEYSAELHKKIYNFLVYQTERSIVDWAKLA